VETAGASLLGGLAIGRHPRHVWAVRYAYTRKGGWRLSCSPVMGMTVTEERLKQRGYRSFKDYYHHIRPKMSAP